MFCLINYNKRSCIKVQTNTLISGQHHCLFMSCRYDLFFFTSLTFLSLFVALTLVSLLSLKDSRARVFLHGYLWKFSFTTYIYIMGLLWVFFFFCLKKKSIMPFWRCSKLRTFSIQLKKYALLIRWKWKTCLVSGCAVEIREIDRLTR